MGKALTDQELHNLAMNIVGKQLEAEGYEFLGVNSKPKKNPQFVCIKEKQLHFIVVRSFRYPDNPNNIDKALMAKVKKHAVGFEAQSHFAGVGLVNATDEQLPVFLNEAYIVNYEGLITV